MKLSRKSLAIGLAAAVLAATAGAVGVADAATIASPTVTAPVVTNVTDTTASISWATGGGAVRTDVQVLGVGQPVQNYRGTVTGTSLTITGLADARPYYVRVAALNAGGQSSGWSDTTLFYTLIVYGRGQVLVSTNATSPTNGTYSQMADYTAQMGTQGPLGISSGGVLRFACTNVTFGCNVKLQASATALGYQLFPRIYVTQQGPGSVTENFAEYGEGADNSGATVSLTTIPADVPVGYGLAFNSPGPNPPPSANGATYLNLPGAAGLGNQYTIITTLTFSNGASR
jgi:hypothetical protein